MANTQSWFQTAKPFLIVVSLQLIYAIMNVISKDAITKGMSTYVYPVYRHVIAFIIITPFALYYERETRPNMTIVVFLKIVALSLLEPVIDQNLYYLGMKKTTATFAAAMANILPALTFLLAFFFRLERIEIRRVHSILKIVGTIVTVGGAMVMTFYRGPILAVPFGGDRHSLDHGASDGQHMAVGAVMITIGTLSCSCFVILQALTLQAYPAALSLTSLICLLGSIEGVVVVFYFEQKAGSSVWSIHLDMGLMAYLFAGIFASGIGYFLQGVVMKTKGPVFVTTFNPLCMVIVAIMGYFLLDEEIILGRVIGAIIICLGLYLVVWGKSRDATNPPQNPNTE